jgi:hypothetical protein
VGEDAAGGVAVAQLLADGVPFTPTLTLTPVPSSRGGGEAQTFWHQCRGHIWGKG